MSEVIKKAIDKIDKEAESLKGEHAKIICQHIIETWLSSEENARAVISHKLQDCIACITSKAKGKASGNVAVISDDVVFGWVKDFYGFTDAPKAAQTDNIIDLFDVL